MIRFKNNADGVLIDGVEQLPELLDVKWCNQSDAENKLNLGEIVLGRQLVDNLQIKSGDTIFLQELGYKNNSIIKPFQICGEISLYGLAEYDKTLAYIKIKMHRQFSLWKRLYLGWIIYSDINSVENLASIPYPFVLDMEGKT